MKKLSLFCFSLCLNLYVNARHYTISEKIMIARLNWLYQVKDFAARQSWPEFAGGKNEIALAYFNDTSTYIIDPGTLLQTRIASIAFYHQGNRPILKAVKRIDDRPFHMETAMDTGDSALLYFNYPVMMCSSFENTRAHIPDLRSLQEWASMVVHEYFHGFQFRHPALTAYGNDSVNLRGSQVQAFYDQNEWFKNSVDKENKLLLACLEMKDGQQVDSALKVFCTLREKRRKRIEDSLHNALARQEDFYEKLEGSAKYVELGLLSAFKHFPPNHRLQQLDTAYKPDAYQHFDLQAEKWMYSTGSLNYFYATGYNLLRVLDKLNIKYKKGFFDRNAISPYSLLKAYLQNKRL